MTTLKVAIATVDEMKEWTMRVVRGEERRKQGDPKLWFPSVESFVKTLSEGHRKLLREIVEKHVSVSLDELSRMTGRKKSDFRGMLNKLSEMGHIEMHLRDGSRLKSKVVDGRVAFVSVSNELTSGSNIRGERTNRLREEPIGRERRVATR